MMEDFDERLGIDQWALDVIDLKQFEYCPRLVYYRYCLPALRPETYNMEAGRRAHDRERQTEVRRSLARYGLAEAERHFDVALYAPQLKLAGRVDLALVVRDGNHPEAIPVDYKDSTRVQPNWKAQLAAYGFLLELAWGIQVRRGFVYLIPVRKAELVKLEERQKVQTRRLLESVLKSIQSESMPAPTRVRGRCVDCEYRRFCNDLF